MAEHLCVTLVPLFNHLDITEQEKINSLIYHRHFQKGEEIFQLGDEKLVIVARGKMKVYQLSANGKEQLLRVVNPGGYEGENQLFGAKNESLIGEAIEATEVCVLTKKDFNALLLEYPQLMLKLLQLNAQKSLQLEQQTHFLTMERIEERLATYLLNLAQAQNTTHPILPMKMKELATFLGTTPETLSRKFKLLETTGLLARKGKQIERLDQEGLEAL